MFLVTIEVTIEVLSSMYVWIADKLCATITKRRSKVTWNFFIGFRNVNRKVKKWKLEILQFTLRKLEKIPDYVTSTVNILVSIWSRIIPDNHFMHQIFSQDLYCVWKVFLKFFFKTRSYLYDFDLFDSARD